MRRKLFALALTTASTLCLVPGYLSSSLPASAQDVAPTQAGACAAPRCSREWIDRHLRLDQIQTVGTAESYKQRPDGSILALVRMGGSKKDAEALDFAEPPISAQLDADARTLSFDVVNDPQGGVYKNPGAANMAMVLIGAAYQARMKQPGFKVMHVPDVDYTSSCLSLDDCLKTISTWSRTHPHHLPIVIALHTCDTKTPMPGATKPVPFDDAAFDALDSEIRAVFTAGELITPDEVQGDAATLREAVLAHRWPTLAAARGKLLFVLDDGDAKVKLYRGARKSLEGRAMFVTADAASPAAAILAIDDPVKDGARIRDAVAQGFIVKTRADDGTVEARGNDVARRNAAFASGAQIITTDFLTPDPKIGAYHASLAEDPGAVCGAALAPERCVGWRDAPLLTARVP